MCVCVCWCVCVCVCVCLVCVCVCVCMCVCVRGILYYVYIFFFLGLCVYFVRLSDFVKRGVLTLVDELPRYSNHRCYYHYYYHYFLVVAGRLKTASFAGAAMKVGQQVPTLCKRLLRCPYRRTTRRGTADTEMKVPSAEIYTEPTHS